MSGSFARVIARIRAVFLSSELNRDLDAELDIHIELRTDDLIRQGMRREQAERMARIELGGLAGLREAHRDTRGLPFVDAIIQDLRFAFRQLRTRPGFSALAAAVLGIGIGANTAIFSVVNGVLLRPLPFANPERLVELFEKDTIGDNNPYNTVAPGNFFDWQRQSRTLEQIAAISLTSFNLSASTMSSAERVDGCGATANLFETLGVAPILGRTFLPEEDRPGGTPVAIISYGLWQRSLAGSPGVLSKRILLDGKMFSVIGVMPGDFRYPSNSTQIWIPLQQHLAPVVLEAHDNHVLSITIGRLRSDTTVEQARAEIDALVKRYRRQHPEEAMGKGGNAVALAAFTLKDTRTPLLLLFAAVGCVLLIACVNVANLLLTRALGRRREIAIRTAIGASRLRIIRQLLVESTVLSLLGAGTGVLLAYSLNGYLATNMPSAEWLPQAGQVHLDTRVRLFSAALAVLTGILAGLFPAFQISRADPARDLKETGRSTTSARRHNWLRDVLVAVEVALSLVLLVAAGLLVRSFQQLLSKDLGLRANDTLIIRVSLPDSGYHERAQVSTFLKKLEDRLRSLPGIKDVGFTSCPIVSVPGFCPDTVFQIEGHASPSGHLMDAEYRGVNPYFFEAAGIPLFKGRAFTQQDGVGLDDKHPHSGQMIVNRAFEKRFFPAENPIGKHIQLYWFVGNNTKQSLLKCEIVGLAGDALERPEMATEPIFYLPILDGDFTDIGIVLHTALPPHAVANEAQSVIRRLDPDLAVFGVQTLPELIDETVRGRRYMTLLFGAFAIVAIVLATVGLYGVVSWGVLQRTNEIAIRMTMGASADSVLRMVVLKALRPTVAGVIAGVPCALLAARVLASFLFQIRPSDPFTFVVVPLLLLGAASFASLLPALRATRIDPMVGLRSE